MRLAELYTVINQWWASKLLQTRISKPGTGHNTADTVRLADGDGTDPDEAYPYTRLEQFGDVCCPPSDSHCIVFAKGEDGVVMSLAASTRPTTDKPGDRGLYCDVAGNLVYLHGSQSATPEQIDIVHKTGSAEKFKQDGSITVDSATGKDVVVNAGTKEVARKGDSVQSGQLSVTVATIAGGQQVNLVYTTGAGAPTPLLSFTVIAGAVAILAPAALATASIDGNITSGAANFKA